MRNSVHAALAHVHDGTVPETLELVRKAEALGVRAFWMTGGLLGPDSLTSLAVAGAHTQRIQLGTSIAITFSRHPLTMAQQVLAIAQIAPGRFRLGIGASHRPNIEDTYGLAFERPLEHLREYTEVLRSALSGEPFTYVGKRFTVRGKLTSAADVPIYLSALRARSYYLAGEVADGAISWVSPSSFIRDVARPALLAGARSAGREATPHLVGHAFGLVTDHADVARGIGRERLGNYLRHANYRELFAAAGYPEAREGRIADALVDDLVLVGDEASVANGIRRFFDRGVDELILTLLAGNAADVERTLRLLASDDLA